MTGWTDVNNSSFSGRLVDNPRAFNLDTPGKRPCALATLAVQNGVTDDGTPRVDFVKLICWHEPRITRFCEMQKGQVVSVFGRMASFRRVHSGLFNSDGVALKDIYEDRLELAVDQWQPGALSKKSQEAASTSPAPPAMPTPAPAAPVSGEVDQLLALLTNPGGMERMQALVTNLQAAAVEQERRLNATASKVNIEEMAPSTPPWMETTAGGPR